VNQAALSPFSVREGFWQRPLGYAHASVSVGMAFLVGVAFHFVIGYRFLPWLLIYVAVVALVVMAVLGRVARLHRVVHWLTGIPFAVTSTAAVSLLALVGGLVPQKTLQQALNIPSIWASWPFLLVIWLMMLNLVGSCGKRCWPLNYTNFVYLCSHLGLTIILIGGGISGLTLDRQNMVLFEGKPTQIMRDAQGAETKTPFTLTLREFVMETFPPTLVYAEANAKGEMKTVPGSALLKKGTLESLHGWKLEVLDYLPRAVFDGEGWRAVNWKTAAPAAFVRASKGNTTKTGWVCSGSVDTPASLLEVGHNQAIAMPDPRPKRFASVVEVTESGQKSKHTVEVNKKLTVAGLDLYQLSYDEKMGAASPYSVLEVVQDRGVPVVFSGIYLLLVGCVLHLWNGIGGKK